MKDGGAARREERDGRITLDVWEHAYYLDDQSERERYVRGFLDHLLNWDFVAANLEAAQLLQSRSADW